MTAPHSTQCLVEAKLRTQFLYLFFHILCRNPLYVWLELTCPQMTEYEAAKHSFK